ncbi:MAG TPA: nucleotide exchange factor GrpE [Bacteroidales bacterium]|nr:nucleotide exchange factor GrpE [Bacteroidales bacterium]
MSKNKNKSNTDELKAEMEAPHDGDTTEKRDNNAENESVNTENMSEGDAAAESEAQESDAAANATEQLMTQVKEWQEKYIRLSADFDNFRKRTMRERMELIKTASEDTLVSILPVIDDFERAMKVMETATEVGAVKEGVTLIYNKFTDVLSQKGLKAIDAQNQEFNTDLHEAITKIPAPDESLKGKVVDVIQKGYTLQDKVVRFAKVVVGE